MAYTRRRLLQAAGGFGAGMLFTPAPWRLLGDTALWTQNWSWLPKLPRGPMTTKATRCTLCAAGCPVRVQLTGSAPTGIRPAGEPLCPAGFVGHHLRYHPQRLRSVTRNGRPASLPELVEAIRDRMATMNPQLKVAVLDLAPGRTASLFCRHVLEQIPNGVYLGAPPVEGGTAAALSRLLETPTPLAINLERTRTLLSVGTPVAEGWARPQFTSRAQRPFRLIQAEANRSRTADVADRWLALQPGGEPNLLLGIAQVLVEEGLASEQAQRCQDYEDFQAAFRGRQFASVATRDVALAIASAQPAAVVADGDPANGPLGERVRTVAAALNVLLGAAGAEGGFVARPETPAPSGWSGVGVTPLDEVEDGAVGLLVLDDPLPGAVLDWSLVESKLASDALVVAASWQSAGVAGRAEWLAPVPVYLEGAQDAPAAVDEPQAVFRVSAALVEPPADAVDAVALLTSAMGEPVSPSKPLEERAAAIHESGGGELWRTGGTEPVPAGSVSASRFWTLLRDGGEWRERAPEGSGVRPVRLLPAGAELGELVRVASSDRREARTYGWRQAAVSPLLGKLWLESDVRKRPGAVLPGQG